MNTTINFNGRAFVLTQDAYDSCRLFPGSFQEVAQGATYTAEYWARAKDDQGVACRMVWQFDVEKGAELADDSHDYSQVYDVVY